MSKKKIWIGVAIAIVVIAVIVGVILMRKKKAPAAPAKSDFPLKYGDSSAKVLIVQQKLNAIMGTPQLVEDGILGADTKEYLLKYSKYPVTQDSYNELLLMA